jgi:hypothetical protein
MSSTTSQAQPTQSRLQASVQITQIRIALLDTLPVHSTPNIFVCVAFDVGFLSADQSSDCSIASLSALRADAVKRCSASESATSRAHNGDDTRKTDAAVLNNSVSYREE